MTFEGNDPEEDSDREPPPPTQPIDKTLPRIGKRDAPDTAPARAPAGEEDEGVAKAVCEDPLEANRLVSTRSPNLTNL